MTGAPLAYEQSQIWAAAAAAKSLQSCPTLHHLMDCSLPGSSIHGIFQARVLEWGAVAFSEIWTMIHHFQGACLHRTGQMVGMLCMLIG